MLKPSLVPKAVIWGTKSGPRVAPGTYQVRLTLNGATVSDSIEVRANPAVGASPADLKKQADFLGDVRDRISATHGAVKQIRDVKAQVKELLARVEKLGKGEALKVPAKALEEKLSAIEDELVNPKLKSNQDVLNFTPRIDHQFVGLATMSSSADAAPTPAAVAYLDELKKKLAGIQARLKDAFEKDLAAFNELVRKQDIAPIVVVP